MYDPNVNFTLCVKLVDFLFMWIVIVSPILKSGELLGHVLIDGWLALAIVVSVWVPLLEIVPKPLVPVAHDQAQLTDFVPSLLCAILWNVKLALTEPPLDNETFADCCWPSHQQFNVALANQVWEVGAQKVILM